MEEVILRGLENSSAIFSGRRTNARATMVSFSLISHSPVPSRMLTLNFKGSVENKNKVLLEEKKIHIES